MFKGRVIFPAHPRIKNLLKDAPSNFEIIDPVGYLEMLRLEREADLIATDSGGVQREAYNYNKKLIILREDTEWPELSSKKKHLLGKGDAYKKCVKILCSII
jgi:UDP-N-acetylglucosamine 2-epimerase